MAVALPSGIDPDLLLMSALQAAMIGDVALFSIGSFSDVEEDFWADTAAFNELFAKFQLLGELAEKPGKTESKVTTIKTRNFSVPGKRSSMVELTLAGLSSLQKDYLESDDFAGAYVTILLLPKNYLDICTLGEEELRLVCFNGLRWKVDWSGEADGLWTVVLSTEFSGSSANKIFPYNVPVPE